MVRPADLKELKEAKLCFVDDNFAYFTTRELSKQWGDDWDDAPYEHNAGYPYEPAQQDLKKGINWSIIKIAFEGPFLLPCSGCCNSPFSVEAINKKLLPG